MAVYVHSRVKKVDLDEARREMESLLEVDDDPLPEPIDTTEAA